MKSREYFLFPDVRHAEDAVRHLRSDGVPEGDMHAIARAGVDLGSLPVAEDRQRRDVSSRVENVLWMSNLGLFGVALAGLMMSLWQASTVGAFLSIAVMVITFLAGERFAASVPNVHLIEFRDALKHGEIVLAVDLPKDRLYTIDRNLISRHPEAVRGGVSWTWPALERV